MKLCKCGHAGDPRLACVCSEIEIAKYRSKLSGPLADRIDMHVVLCAVSSEMMRTETVSETSLTIRARVEAARSMQRRRYAEIAGVECNARASGRSLHRGDGLGVGARRLLDDAMDS